MPYGYHNFLFGWIDTPEDNWPPLLPAYFAPILFSIVGKVAPATMDIFFYQAMNHRLGTVGLQMEDLTATAAEQGMSIDEVMAMPEQDGWIYSGIQGNKTYLSYVCSAYVAAVYKAAGMFDDMVINGVEFTPKDVYDMNIFDTNWDRPDVCV